MKQFQWCNGCGNGSMDELTRQRTPSRDPCSDSGIPDWIYPTEPKPETITIPEDLDETGVASLRMLQNVSRV